MGLFHPAVGGGCWAGDPDMGTGARQPGGWIYSLLPFLELHDIHQMGAGLPWNTPEKWKALSQREGRGVGLFHCPSRGRLIAHPTSGRLDRIFCPRLMPNPDAIATTDYAAIGGTHVSCGGELHGGPETVNCPKTYPNCRWASVFVETCQSRDTSGICFFRSEIGLKDISDGAHCTYFAGEKYLNPDHYYSIDHWNDGGVSMYRGYPLTMGWCFNEPSFLPRQDTPGYTNFLSFGSAHSGGFHMLMCDGSVHAISYTIDGQVHEHLGNRRDGEVIGKLPW